MFDFNKVIDLTEIAQYKQIKDKTGCINCSSNELIHLELSLINKKIHNDIILDEDNKYVSYIEKISTFSELLKIEKTRLQLYAGSDDAIKIILAAFNSKCKTLIIQNPNYENYFHYALLNHYCIKKWNINQNSLNFDLQVGINAIDNSKDNSLVVITSPSGFTGNALDNYFVQAVAKKCYEKNNILVIDQAYLPFSNGLSYRDIFNHFENVILVSTFSKGFGLAGARIAYTESSPILAKYLSMWNGINPISALSFSIAEKYLLSNMFNKIIIDIIVARERLIGFIKNHTPWQTCPSYSNFVLVILSNKIEAEELTEYLYANKVIVRHLFGFLKDNCIRITCIYEIDIIIQLLEDFLIIQGYRC